MTEITYSGAQLIAALATTEQRIYQAAGDNGVDDAYWPLRDELPEIDPAGQYTLAEFSGMLNDAANELDEQPDYEDSGTIWAQDVRNLSVNCAGYLLEHPEASLEEIITVSYGGELHPISDPDSDDWKAEITVGDPRYDEALIEEVLGWVS